MIKKLTITTLLRSLNQNLQRLPNALLFLAALAMALIASSAKQEEPSQVTKPIDTYIPRGYVLLPLPIENKKTLRTIIGDKAVINLYRKKEGGKPRLIARNLRILSGGQAPLQMNILVKENLASQLLQREGSYWAAIQNSQESSAPHFLKPSKKRIHILTGDPSI